MSKERLVELIGNAPIGVNGITLLDKHEPKVIEEIADYLLANAVVVPDENEALLPITKKELHLIQNDVIAYCLRLEEMDCDKDETFGYSSRKALLEKLYDFERKYFDRYTECPTREEAEAKLKESNNDKTD